MDKAMKECCKYHKVAMRRKCRASGHGISSPGFIKYEAKGCRGEEMDDDGVVSNMDGSLGCGRRCLLSEERNIVS